MVDLDIEVSIDHVTTVIIVSSLGNTDDSLSDCWIDLIQMCSQCSVCLTERTKYINDWLTFHYSDILLLLKIQRSIPAKILVLPSDKGLLLV